MTKIPTFSVTSATLTTVSPLSTIQSANSLFRFVAKLEYLLSDLERGALVPRYCEEIVKYLNLGFDRIAYPMLCFCDINFHQLDSHVAFYGGYSIAFSKAWGICHGIQPIQYMNELSNLQRDFTYAYNAAKISTNPDEAHDYLLSQMSYFKPIEGEMVRDGKTELKNFTDECEWRYIPLFNDAGLPDVLQEKDMVYKERLNSALLYDESSWLRFDIEDIKYIILQNADDFNSVEKIVSKMKGQTREKRQRLISKIVIWSESKEDF